MGDDALAMENAPIPKATTYPEVDGTRDKALANYDHNNSRTCRLLKPSIT
jgi:hypothetical protein